MHCLVFVLQLHLQLLLPLSCVLSGEATQAVTENQPCLFALSRKNSQFRDTGLLRLIFLVEQGLSRTGSQHEPLGEGVDKSRGGDKEQ